MLGCGVAAPSAAVTTDQAPAGDIVAIDALDRSARLRPSDAAHVAVLARVLDATPPVLVRVDGDRLRLLDGFMRVEAALALGRSSVRAEVVHGDEASVLERAVRANASHGLPLSARQRREVGRRLLELAPEWSDRRIASAVGVDPRSVGRWRSGRTGRSGEDTPHLSGGERVGKDGRRSRPAEALQVRRDAARRLLREEPRLSDREVGRRAGLSAAAVRRVRVQLAPAGQPSLRRGGVARRLLSPARGVVGKVVGGLAEVLRRLLRALVGGG